MDYGHKGLGEAPVGVYVHDGSACAEDHDPLHHSREEEESEGDANDRVDDAEGLASTRQGGGVAITCRGKKAEGP